MNSKIRRRENSTFGSQFDDAESGYVDENKSSTIRPFIFKQYQFEANENEPWRFSENDNRYRICCGIIHIKTMIICLTVVKTCFVLWFVLWRILLQNQYAMFALTSIFGISLILSSHTFLIIGVIVKKYKLLIPYFTLSLFLILILMMKLFIDVIGTANTKDTPESNKLQMIAEQTIVISVEVYSVFLVWKVFDYITDYYMEKDYLRNVKIAQRRKIWEMKYTKGFDQFMREMQKLKPKEQKSTTDSGKSNNSKANAEPHLQKQQRPSIHRFSQNSTTTTSE